MNGILQFSICRNESTNLSFHISHGVSSYVDPIIKDKYRIEDRKLRLTIQQTHRIPCRESHQDRSPISKRPI